MIFLVCLIHNASTYVEKKYNKDFKIISIKLPYYKDDSDFFDWPLLYRPGEFVPFAVNFKDTEKDFSVIYNKSEFYDDYQLEEINRYMKEYLINVTGDSDITDVLVLHTPYSSSYYEYDVLTNILKKDNTKWTSENIEKLIQEIFADYNGIKMCIRDSMQGVCAINAPAYFSISSSRLSLSIIFSFETQRLFEQVILITGI